MATRPGIATSNLGTGTALLTSSDGSVAIDGGPAQGQIDFKVAGGPVTIRVLLSAAVAAANAAGARAFPGAQVGDKVVQAIDLTGVDNATAFFEPFITVPNQVQQLAGFPGAQVLVPMLLSRG
jgi:hypothetical protein